VNSGCELQHHQQSLVQTDKIRDVVKTTAKEWIKTIQIKQHPVIRMTSNEN